MEKNFKGDKLQLWKNLQNYNLGSPDSLLSFTNYVAIKLGWNVFNVRRVFEEYKKFVFLSVITKGHALPSAMIDRIWQKHVDDRVIYEEFCMEVIGYNLDMNIIRRYAEGDEDSGGLNDRYLDTLALYKKEFQEDPAEDIWFISSFDYEHPEGDQRVAQARRKTIQTGISPNVQAEEDHDFPSLTMLLNIQQPTFEEQPFNVSHENSGEIFDTDS